jgi:putative NADPH-quinone reductase
MTHRIAIVQGHSDPTGNHLCHALADAYGGGANNAGREVQQVEVARLDFPPLRTEAEFVPGNIPPGLVDAQDALQNAFRDMNRRSLNGRFGTIWSVTSFFVCWPIIC